MPRNNKLDLYIREPYFSQIESGQKTIEGRIAKPYLRNQPIGAELNFIRGRDKKLISTHINSLHIYGSLLTMLQNEDLELLLPGYKSIEKGVRIYESLPNFKENARNFGVIAIHFSIEKIDQ